MAGRPRKASVNNENNTDNKDVVSVEHINANNAENDTLKKENDELRKQLKMVLEQMSSQNSNVKENTSVTKDSIDDVELYKEINPLKPIKVVSLSDGGVSLKTNANGSGKSFRFDKFGHSISITYSDLQDVIAMNRSFIEDGTVYICDEDVVKNNYLDEYYSKFLTVDKITNILSFDISDIIDMVSNTTETIQETIISLLVKKINNNEYVDMNKIDAIGKCCKKPCDINTLALQKRTRN